MAQPFTFDLKGFTQLQNRLNRASVAVRKEIDAELGFAAENIARNAKRDAPVDEGRIRGSISVQKKKENEFDIVSASEYSPYMEWGTKRRVKIPTALAAYASQFRGPGRGTAAEAIRSLTGWVKRKGIRYDSAGKFKSGKRKGHAKQLSYEQTAWIIFHYIMLVGIRPRPYFFKNFDNERPKLLKNIENVLNRI